MSKFYRSVSAILLIVVLASCSAFEPEKEVVLMEAVSNVATLDAPGNYIEITPRAVQCGDQFLKVSEQHIADTIVIEVLADRSGICPTFPLPDPAPQLFSTLRTDVMVLIKQPDGTFTEYKF